LGAGPRPTYRLAVNAEVGIGAPNRRLRPGRDARRRPAQIDRAAAEELIEQAHQVCPYLHATRGNIEVALRVGQTR